jgi:hypothetical protein
MLAVTWADSIYRQRSMSARTIAGPSDAFTVASAQFASSTAAAAISYSACDRTSRGEHYIAPPCPGAARQPIESVVNRFSEDGIMVFFNPPVPRPGHSSSSLLRFQLMAGTGLAAMSR